MIRMGSGLIGILDAVDFMKYQQRMYLVRFYEGIRLLLLVIPDSFHPQASLTTW